MPPTNCHQLDKLLIFKNSILGFKYADINDFKSVDINENTHEGYILCFEKLLNSFWFYGIYQKLYSSILQPSEVNPHSTARGIERKCITTEGSSWLALWVVQLGCHWWIRIGLALNSVCLLFLYTNINIRMVWMNNCIIVWNGCIL